MNFIERGNIDKETVMDIFFQSLSKLNRIRVFPNKSFICGIDLFCDRYSDSQVPTHPCLKLVANSEQGLTRSIGRRLITMEKVSELEVT